MPTQQATRSASGGDIQTTTRSVGSCAIRARGPLAWPVVVAHLAVASHNPDKARRTSRCDQCDQPDHGGPVMKRFLASAATAALLATGGVAVAGATGKSGSTAKP